MPSNFSTVIRIDRIRLMTLTCLLVFGLTSVAPAQKDSGGPPASPMSDPEGFLNQLGGDLKMAVRVQAMSGEDAKAVWEAASGLLSSRIAEKEEGEAGEDAKREDGGNLWYAMRVPDGGDFRTLLRPEFVRRDIDLIVDRLGFDRATRPIAESILLDYEDAFADEVSEFRELLDLGSQQVEIARLEPGYRAVDPSNWAAIEGSIVDAMSRRGSGEDRINGTLDWVASRLEGMRTRLEMLEPIVAKRRDAIDRRGGRIEGREVIDAMNRMDRRRRELRLATVESISALLESDMESTFLDLLDEIRIQHGMVDSRMGGATTDLVSALDSVDGDVYEASGLGDDEPEILREISNLFDARTESRIRREKQALELAIEEIESRGDADSRVRSRVRGAATAELTAELAIRDAILGRIEFVRSRLESIDPEAAAAFLETARRTGFRAQMRTRWCEKAIDLALELEGLDEAMLASLLAIDDSIVQQMAFLRTDAIQRRIENETRVARAMVEAVTDDGAEAKSLGEQAWREPGYEGFDRLDAQVESQLLAVLGPERFGELPPRPGGEKRDAKSGGKTRSKSDAKGGGKDAGGSKRESGDGARGKTGKG